MCEKNNIRRPFGKTLLFFFCGMISGGVLFAFVTWIVLRGSLILQEECVLPYEAAVKAFPARAAALGWSVRSVPCGLPAPVKGKRIAVFEICSREYAGRILAEKQSRKNAAVLPCKVAIYESGGKVRISRLNGFLIAVLSGPVCRETFFRHILPEQDMILFDLLNGKENM